MVTKKDIIAQLQKEILPLQGFKSLLNNTALDTVLGPIKNAFPDKSFPVGVVHEFIANTAENGTVTAAFISVLLNSLMKGRGVCIWIGASNNIFPSALKSFGVVPDKIIFIDLKKEKEILWAMEEALKCEGLSAVIAQVQDLSFTNSRRLQLAVEKSLVTGFVIRQNPRSVNTTACVTRWKITSLSSNSDKNIPGLGFPRWNIDLLKVRNGRPGNWQVEYISGDLRYAHTTVFIPLQKKKTG